MTDQRPRYGEYATPDEQRLRAGLPPVEAVVVPEASVAAAEHLPAAAPAPSRRGDRIITIALLAYGLVNVIFTALSYLDLATPMNEAMKLMGIKGEFTNFGPAKTWGTIAAVVLILGWVVTALLSVRRLRAQKITWWLPLVGAVATFFVVSICISVPLTGDPAFIAYVDSLSAG